jgi:DNA-binding MarR family transcriptional regulator/N-acetylglutamate synthase-like GNAT family acetyltransferase
MILARLKEAGGSALPITAIANDLGITYPGVVKLVREMENKGLVTSARDQGDARKRGVHLTAGGRRLASELEPVWAAFETATRRLFEEVDGDLIALLDRIEERLEETGFAERIIACLGDREEKAEIIDFRPELAGHFRRLNEEWLEEMFRVEEYDRRQLDHPKETIIDRGGDILFARRKKRIVGTAALVRLSTRRSELAKMVVTRESRRHGVGKTLLEAAIERARSRGATSLVLQTHSKHRAAVNLYRQHGFEVRRVRIPVAGILERARGGFTMALDLRSIAKSMRNRS